jgi:hypothetical protein
MRRSISSCAGLSIAFSLLFVLSGCKSEKKVASIPEIHEGDHLTAYTEEITSPTHEFEVKVGETYVLDIDVKNTGAQPWFGHATSAWVDASYRWLDPKGNVLPLEGKRTILTNAVLQPGMTEHMKLQVVAPPNPGSYTLWVSMVQEGVTWFYWEGATPLVLQVTVD